MGLSRMVTIVACVTALLSPASASAAPEASGPVNTAPPTVEGVPTYREALVATPGTWTPEPVAVAYQWLRDGRPLATATRRTYRPTLDDLRHRLAVRVTVTDAAGQTGEATSAETGRVRKARFGHGKLRIDGVRRYGAVLTPRPARIEPRPTGTRFEWFTAPGPGRGVAGRRYRVGPTDVGRGVYVEQVVRRAGYRTERIRSGTTRPIMHRVPVRRVATYSVQTRGSITANLGEFRRQAQQTFDDPRGWRSAGVEFRPVARGGDFTLVLAAASAVPGFSAGCSAMWSCRVGRYVIVNQTRWATASPAWNAARRSLRDYRHLVVNHETGHWLGHGHRGCAGSGPAPVMMQQSKGTGGCSFNPWPLPSERWIGR